MKQWFFRIISVWFFISALYVLLFEGLPNLIKWWVLDNLGKDTIIIFSAEQIGALGNFVWYGIITSFLGLWTFKVWKDIIKKKD